MVQVIQVAIVVEVEVVTSRFVKLDVKIKVKVENGTDVFETPKAAVVHGIGNILNGTILIEEITEVAIRIVVKLEVEVENQGTFIFPIVNLGKDVNKNGNLGTVFELEVFGTMIQVKDIDVIQVLRN